MTAAATFFLLQLASLLLGVAAIPSRQDLEARRQAAWARRSSLTASSNPLMGIQPNETASVPTISFSNPKAREFLVDGSRIPDVPFDLGPSWAGLLPITGHVNETRKLFFWFWPAKTLEGADDLMFWTNGGPGCSSLEGMLQQNGPFTWASGTAQPRLNQWSWTNLSHVLWVEQPIGTGFSQGEVEITNDEELAVQVAGFLEQFLNVFTELKGKNFYLGGENYAGYYVPYIANYLYEHPHDIQLKTKGIWLADAAIAWDIVQEYIPTYAFVQKWKDVFAFSKEFMLELRAMSDECGYTDFTQKYLTYPPRGPMPLPEVAFYGLPNARNITGRCMIWDTVVDEAFNVNPNFNLYRIFDAWPIQWDVLAYPGSIPNQQSPIYFNRTDVQKAIHAPEVDWRVCTAKPVYVLRNDTSLPSSLTVLPSVIEKSERSVIMQGMVDMMILSEGTRLAIQNMTWGGKQGFQTPIEDDSFAIDRFGVLGSVHEERKLTYIEVNLAGHMIPKYAPWAAYKSLAYLLGRTHLNSTSFDEGLYPNDLNLFGGFA